MTRLLRALRRSAEKYDVSVAFESLSETPWESATFSGFVHRIAVIAEASPAFDIWLAALHEIDLPVPGHIVADIAVITREEGVWTIAVHTIAA